MNKHLFTPSGAPMMDKKNILVQLGKPMTPLDLLIETWRGYL